MFGLLCNIPAYVRNHVIKTVQINLHNCPKWFFEQKQCLVTLYFIKRVFSYVLFARQIRCARNAYFLSLKRMSPRTSSKCRIYFLVLWDHQVHYKLPESRGPLKPVLRGVAGVAHFINGLEQTQ